MLGVVRDGHGPVPARRLRRNMCSLPLIYFPKRSRPGVLSNSTGQSSGWMKDLSSISLFSSAGLGERQTRRSSLRNHITNPSLVYALERLSLISYQTQDKHNVWQSSPRNQLHRRVAGQHGSHEPWERLVFYRDGPHGGFRRHLHRGGHQEAALPPRLPPGLGPVLLRGRHRLLQHGVGAGPGAHPGRVHAPRQLLHLRRRHARDLLCPLRRLGRVSAAGRLGADDVLGRAPVHDLDHHGGGRDLQRLLADRCLDADHL